MLCDAVSELQYATDCSLGGIGQGRTLPQRAERGRKGLSGRRCDFSPWCIIGTEHSQYISCGRKYQDIDITSKLIPQHTVLYNSTTQITIFLNTSLSSIDKRNHFQTCRHTLYKINPTALLPWEPMALAPKSSTPLSKS